MRLDTKASPPRFALLIIALLFLDLGPTTIQSPYRTDREFLRDGLRKAADLINPHRTLLGYTSDYGTHFSAWAYTEDSDLIIPVGSFPQGAPRSLNSVTAMTDALNISADSLASVRLDFLYLWDVVGLVTNRRDRFVPPRVEGLKVRGTDPPIAWLDFASPLVFSKCLAVAEDDSLYDLNQVNLVLKGDHTIPERQSYVRRMVLWTNGMGIERSQKRANCIFLAKGEGARGLKRGTINSNMTLPHIKDPKYLSDSTNGFSSLDSPNNNMEGLTINDFRVDLMNVKISYNAIEEGYLRLAFSWYPTLKVLVDREPVIPLRSLFGASIIATEAGEHTIELAPGRSRGYLLPILAGTLFGAVMLCLAVRSRQ